jgi:hypothetical protein
MGELINAFPSRAAMTSYLVEAISEDQSRAKIIEQARNIHLLGAEELLLKCMENSPAHKANASSNTGSCGGCASNVSSYAPEPKF